MPTRAPISSIGRSFAEREISMSEGTFQPILPPRDQRHAARALCAKPGRAGKSAADHDALVQAAEPGGLAQRGGRARARQEVLDVVVPQVEGIGLESPEHEP